MKYFLKRLSVFLLVLYVTAWGLDHIVTQGLKLSEHLMYKVHHEISQGVIAADVLINGSSRAMVGVSPVIISQALNRSSYNLGMHAYRFDMQLARYQLYRKHQLAPKLMIQTLDFFSFERDPHNTARQQFLPYLDQEDLFRTLEKYGYFSWYDRFIPLIRYRGFFQPVLMGLLEFLRVKHFTCEIQNGYEPRKLKWNSDFENFKKSYPQGILQKIEKTLVEDFERYLETLKKEHVRVVLVYLPEFVEAQPFIKNRAQVIALYRQLAQKHAVLFLDYSSDGLSLDQQYFYNALHLNQRGSEIFTKKLAQDLRR
jgi:hypothetical protein